MRISQLHIHNFRGLADIGIEELSRQLNVFIGVNGAGKSSILDVVSILMTWYVRRMESPSGRGQDIPIEDVKNNTYGGCRIGLSLDNGVSWSLYRSKAKEKTEKSDLSQLNTMLKAMWGRMDTDKNMPLPVVAHYRVNRSVSDIPLKIRHLDEARREDTYQNALLGSASFRDFFAWFRLQEDLENEHIRDDRNYRDRGLECIRQAMYGIFPEYSDMKVQRRPQALLLKKNDEEFRLNQLSDGEKCYIALVCDLTSRLVMANPDGNPLEGNGIVLIDEIDLHLHPQWQTEVLSKLTRTFPNCQFFVSTHSPLVVADGIGRIFALREGRLVALPQLRGIDYSAILRDFMDTSSSNALITALADEYVAYSQYGMQADAEQAMRTLRELVPDESAPIYTAINAKLRAAR